MTAPMTKSAGDIGKPMMSSRLSGFLKAGSGSEFPVSVADVSDSQLLVGAGCRSHVTGEGVTISPEEEASNDLTVSAVMAGDSGLAVNGSGIGTPDPIVGGNGGRSLVAIVGSKVSVTFDAFARKNVDLPTPLSGSWRGKQFGSDILYCSDWSGEQKSGIVSGCFGFPVEQNVGIGAMMPVAGDLSHGEQNGHCEVDMEVGPCGNSEAGNSGNNGNSGIVGKVWGGNNVDRNGDPTPVKSWKNLFSVPTKTNGQLQYSRPLRTDGKFVVKPPEEAVMEGIDMWKGCLVG